MQQLNTHITDKTRASIEALAKRHNESFDCMARKAMNAGIKLIAAFDETEKVKSTEEQLDLLKEN